MRIKKMITEKNCLDLLSNSLNTSLRKCTEISLENFSSLNSLLLEVYLTWLTLVIFLLMWQSLPDMTK